MSSGPGDDFTFHDPHEEFGAFGEPSFEDELEFELSSSLAPGAIGIICGADADPTLVCASVRVPCSPALPVIKMGTL